MTRDHDEDQVGQESADADELQRRLDQTRAELTGHVPVPDQRLEAMFATGHAHTGPRAGAHEGPGDDAGSGGLAAVLPVEPVAEAGAGSEPPARRRIAVVAIAASFLLVVGLAVYAAAGRGDSDVPVETAAGTTDTSQPLNTDQPDGSEGDELRADDASERPADSSSQEGQEGREGQRGQEGTDGEGGWDIRQADDLGEWFDGHLEDGEGFFGFDFDRELGSLFAEDQEWFECVATTVEEWISEGLESHAEGDRHDDSDRPGRDGDEDGIRRFRPHFFQLGDLDIEGECGEPVIAEGFAWPDLELPESLEDFEFPELLEDLELPGFDEDICETTETDDGVSIACRWPPALDLDELEGALRFGFGFEFDPDFDLDELEERLTEQFGELEDELREHFGEFEGRLRQHLGEFESWLGELERHSRGTGAGNGA